MNIFVFDIETIPDVARGRRLYDLDGLSDEDTGKAIELIKAASCPIPDGAVENGNVENPS